MWLGATSRAQREQAPSSGPFTEEQQRVGLGELQAYTPWATPPWN